jgi:peptidoglycan hydrolase-like protein with peptidoglycan-binding domain
MGNGLRKGSNSAEVKAMQQALGKAGFPVTADGNFGDKTDSAVRLFQRKIGLLPDGVVGTKTLLALGIGKPGTSKPASHSFLEDLIKGLGPSIVPHAQKAKNQSPPPSLPPKNVQAMSLSKQGFDFIYRFETFPNISNILHHPSDASGVTLGPGYDMKERSSATIITDMTAIGLDRSTAEKISKAAFLSRNAAQEFVDNNEDLVDLAPAQQMKILVQIAPQYERLVKKYIRVDLKQYEFDALVSFAYNPATKFVPVCNNINDGKVEDAMKLIKSVVYSGAKLEKSLQRRRDAEVPLYVYGTY